VEVSLYRPSLGGTPAGPPSLTPSAVVPLSNSNSTLWHTETFLAPLGALPNLKMPDLSDDHKMISRIAPHFSPWRRSLFRSCRNNHRTWMTGGGRTVGAKTNLALGGMYKSELQYNQVDMSDSHSCVFGRRCRRTSPHFLVPRNQRECSFNSSNNSKG
jgi:hypothetical protein